MASPSTPAAEVAAEPQQPISVVSVPADVAGAAAAAAPSSAQPPPPPLSSAPAGSAGSATATPADVNGHDVEPHLHNTDHLGNPRTVMIVQGKRPYLTPRIMLREMSDRLTPFESSEVLDFPEIYYYGYGAAKIKGIPWAPNNHGYDDIHGDLRLVRHDHLVYRYKLIEKLGKGSFGQVVRALDYKTGEPVAIKIIRNKKRFFQQALTEVRILEHIRKKDQTDKTNIVRMLYHFVFRSHLCIVFELLGQNLYESIRRNSFKGFPIDTVKHISIQLLQCLDLLHRESIIHCDLKPENILLKYPRRSAIKVIDFGSSCFSNETVHAYIQSRFYRSPEVVLGLSYGTSIDIWSFACIVAELITGYPLFAANNEADLLSTIIQLLGPPPRSLVQHSSRAKTYFDENGQPKPSYDSKGNLRVPGSRQLATVLNRNDPDLLDLLKGCLQWEAANRLTPYQALHHRWFANAVCPAEGFNLDFPSPITDLASGSSSSSSGTIVDSSSSGATVIAQGVQNLQLSSAPSTTTAPGSAPEAGVDERPGPASTTNLAC